MKESISYTYLLNMMLIFIIVSFSVIMAVMSYSKAYRVNSKITGAIEKFEGYNDKSKSEINRIISGFGYQKFGGNCGKKNEQAPFYLENESENRGYCIYYFDDGDYYYYGVTTYMLFDFPIIDLLRLPVYTTTEKIYKLEEVVE